MAAAGRSGAIRAVLSGLCLGPLAADAGALDVRDDAGAVVASIALPDDGRWCLVWNHSVTGEEVRDCFRTEARALILERSHQIDFSSAGLGHVPGRGTVVPDPGGGQWIEGIGMAVPDGALPLRVGGSAVDHRIDSAGGVTSLSALAAGRRVTIRAARSP
jgi:hypothetical protein